MVRFYQEHNIKWLQDVPKRSLIPQGCKVLNIHHCARNETILLSLVGCGALDTASRVGCEDRELELHVVWPLIACRDRAPSAAEVDEGWVLS